MLTYSLGFALVAALFVAVTEVFGGNRDSKPIGVGLTTFVICAFLNFILIYVLIPPFTHFLVGGYPLLLFVDLAIGLIVAALIEASGALAIGGTISGILLVVWFVWAGILTRPGLICDNTGYKEMASLLDVQTAATSYPDTDLSHIIRVAEITAWHQADRLIGSDADLGAYLTPNRAYLQKVQGHFYYIVDLKVTDWLAFRNSGAVVPGYIVVDAMDPDADPEFRSGYQMHYVPEARWNADLDRYTYDNFLLGNPWRVDDLDGLEVDDDWQPFYTGTLLRHSVGWNGKSVDGVITVDPQSGQITKYSVDEAPEWIDRIWSESLVNDYAGWWGNFEKHTACIFSGGANQRQVDDTHDVVTSEGLAFQITMTSVGADQSLTEVLYVEPRTGKATKYEITGTTVEAVGHLAEEVSHKANAEGYDAAACQLQVLLGRQVWYCLMTGRAGGNSGSEGSRAGVTLIQANHTFDNTKAIFDPTLEGAYQQLQAQIAEEELDNPTLAEAQQLNQQFSGTIVRKELWISLENKRYFLFSLETAKGVLYFRVGAEDLAASWMQEGDRVVVTAYEVAGDDFLNVVHIAIPADAVFAH